jgi:hypothetical protein
MPTTVDCPTCSRKLRIPDELLGKKVKCPQCGNAFLARAPAAPAEEMGEEEAPAPPPKAAAAPARRPAAPPPAEDEEEPEEEAPAPRRRGGNGGLKPHRGVVILIMGILSIVIGYIGIILGPISWSMGGKDLQEIEAGRMDPEGRSLTNAGRICGIIGTILGGLEVLCCVGYLIFIGVMVGSGAMK